MKPIHRILIANRGEIARRIVRTANLMGIESVVVYSGADANSLPVREATVSYALDGNTSAETYLDIDKLLTAAKATDADAVHPGYGFLSENADFAQAVLAAGLTWIGPSPAAIDAVGSKAGAKRLAKASSVPCLPGYFESTQSDEALSKAAKALGFPLMVKASNGGGGRGMRLVLNDDTLLQAIAGARSEAITAFGSGDLVLERALLKPRHVEVQIFADSHGNCIHLGERDCSVQRRHQKIIEESPSPAITDKVRTAMCAAAVKLALAAGYEGAGTVEFLVEEAGDEVQFYLMEMNTRLQVEHCVTEMRTGLDLVEWQIRVARGEALPLAQKDVQFLGHAIEVRLCAEDESFMPQQGCVQTFIEPKLRGIRFDHALESGSVVSPFYDAMLGKVIAHAPSRVMAINSLINALQQTTLLGLATNRAFLIECLDHPMFRSGEAQVPFLLEHGDAIRQSLDEQRAIISLDAAIHVVMSSHRLGAKKAPLGCPFPRAIRIKQNGQTQGGMWLAGQSSFAQEIQFVQMSKDHFHAQHRGLDWFLEDVTFAPPEQPDLGATAIEVRAPFNGKVITVNAQAGKTIAAGATLFVVESMKLEHAVQAQRSGIVAEVLAHVGLQVAPKQVLMRFAAKEAT
jgi:geranyl-CoA carboxylase alpha subunit